MTVMAVDTRAGKDTMPRDATCRITEAETKKGGRRNPGGTNKGQQQQQHIARAVLCSFSRLTKEDKEGKGKGKEEEKEEEKEGMTKAVNERCIDTSSIR